MKVFFNQGVVGINFDYRPRVVYDLPPQVAKPFIKQGVASIADGQGLSAGTVESAAVDAAPERAVLVKNGPKLKRRG